MVSTRMRIDASGRFSSRSRNEKCGFPDISMMSSIVLLINASWPHLKFDSSTEIRFGCRATNFAAHILWLELAEKVCFQTSEMSSGDRIWPAATSAPNKRSSRSSSRSSRLCENPACGRMQPVDGAPGDVFHHARNAVVVGPAIVKVLVAPPLVEEVGDQWMEFSPQQARLRYFAQKPL